jgi:GNAT superfamily N-acetyltransferase
MPDFPAGLTLELLDARHKRKRFSSGDARVDEWLVHKALSAMRKHTSTTRVVADSEGKIAGFYTLVQTALDVSLVPPELFGGKPPAHAPPTLTLAWLGVDQAFKRQGLGTRLLDQALADCVRAYDTVRFVAVLIDALTEANLVFYRSQGFLPVPSATHKLYLPASTLIQVVKQE